jgi:hypothetical protein
MKYKTKIPSTAFTDAQWERTAITYALWLAEKRGIKLPECTSRVEWSDVAVYTSTNKRRHEKRIRAVTWGSWQEIYNTRKDDRRGAFSHKEWQVKFELELPHWDWNPEKVIDHSQPYHLYNHEFEKHSYEHNEHKYEIWHHEYEREREAKRELLLSYLMEAA